MRRTLLLLSAMMMMVVLAAGVAVAAEFTCSTDPCLGTRGNDEIHGTDNPETIRALAGNDYVISNGGNDTIYGEAGKDGVDSAGGNDTIYGGDGNDGNAAIALIGGEDSDTVYGGKGNDFIDAGAFDRSLESPDPPRDYSYGEGGNDTIDAVDGNEDIIDCGAGRKDTVYYDERIDTVTNCEVLNPTTIPSV
jgi:serralysin